jgi:hypothetical protein
LTCLAAPLAAADTFGTERRRSSIAGLGAFVLAGLWMLMEFIVALRFSGCPPST